MSQVSAQAPKALCFREESLKEFGSIYEQEYGETLEGDALEAAARNLLGIYTAVYGNPKQLVNKTTHYDRN